MNSRTRVLLLIAGICCLLAVVIGLLLIPMDLENAPEKIIRGRTTKSLSYRPRVAGFEGCTLCNTPLEVDFL